MTDETVTIGTSANAVLAHWGRLQDALPKRPVTREQRRCAHPRTHLSRPVRLRLSDGDAWSEWVTLPTHVICDDCAALLPPA